MDAVTLPAHSYALDTTWRTLLHDLGLRPGDVLRRAGLPDDLLARPNASLPSQDYYRLWQAIEDMTDGPLALRLCEVVRAEAFSPPLFAALCSPDLVTAARRIGKYKRLIAPIRLDAAMADGRLTVEFTWLDAPFVPPDSLVLMDLLFTVALVRMGTCEPVRPIEVVTTVPPARVDAYEAFLGARIRKGDGHRVVFAAADATRPFLTSNDALWTAFEPDLRRRLADLDGAASTVERVRAALLEALPSGLVSMDAIARRLGAGKRTLQRRIEAEGTSYQALLNATREALARHYLERTTLPPTEIAFLLGFDEPNSFFRAFRTWTGTTPEVVRRGGSPDD